MRGRGGNSRWFVLHLYLHASTTNIKQPPTTARPSRVLMTTRKAMAREGPRKLRAPPHQAARPQAAVLSARARQQEAPAGALVRPARAYPHAAGRQRRGRQAQACVHGPDLAISRAPEKGEFCRNEGSSLARPRRECYPMATPTRAGHMRPCYRTPTRPPRHDAPPHDVTHYIGQEVRPRRHGRKRHSRRNKSLYPLSYKLGSTRRAEGWRISEVVSQ